MKFGETARVLGWQLRNIASEESIGAPNFDSRKIIEGELFFGLRGEIDGGKFAESALKRGAQAAVVSEEWADKMPAGSRYIVVEDPLEALTQLGRLTREQFKGRVFAVTGSCGKTTVKELMKHVFSSKYRVLCNPGSFNNHIGVPYTLSRLNDNYDIAIIEMGANHPGEIAGLCRITKPDAGLITMVGRAHLEGFGDMAGVAEAKGELFRGLNGQRTAFVNFDDAYVTGQAVAVQKRIGYGFNFPAGGMSFARIYQGIMGSGGFSVLHEYFEFPFPDFMQIHALSTTAAAHSWGVDTHLIKEALKSFPGVKGRMKRYEYKGSLFYDDTYNANPSSLSAALKFIANLPGGRKIAVLGDMMELGKFSDEEHLRVLETARILGYHSVMTFGDNFAKAGSSLSFDSHEIMAKEIEAILKPGDIVLFKGSHSMGIDKVLDFFVQGRL